MTQPDLSFGASTNPHADDARLVAETLGAGWHCHASRGVLGGDVLVITPPGTGERNQALAADSPFARALVTLARQHAAWKDGHTEYRDRVRELAAKATRAIGDLAQ